MEMDLQMDSSEKPQQVELDILKIIEQLGFDKNRWLNEWNEAAEQNISN